MIRKREKRQKKRGIHGGKKGYADTFQRGLLMTSNEKRQERDRKHEKASRRGQSARGKELLEKRAGRYAENGKNKHEHSLRSRNLFLHRTEHFKSPDQRESINQTVEKQIVDENFQKKKHEQHRYIACARNQTDFHKFNPSFYTVRPSFRIGGYGGRIPRSLRLSLCPKIRGTSYPKNTAPHTPTDTGDNWTIAFPCPCE